MIVLNVESSTLKPENSPLFTTQSFVLTRTEYVNHSYQEKKETL